MAYLYRAFVLALMAFAVVAVSDRAFAASGCYVDAYGDYICDGTYTPPSGGSPGSGGTPGGGGSPGGGPIFLPGGGGDGNPYLRRTFDAGSCSGLSCKGTPYVDTSVDATRLFFRRDHEWYTLAPDPDYRRGDQDVVAFSAPPGTGPTDYMLDTTVVRRPGNEAPKGVIRDSSGAIVAEQTGYEVAVMRFVFSDTGTLTDAELAANPNLKYYTVLRTGEIYTFEGSVTPDGGPYSNDYWFRMTLNKYDFPS